MFMENTPGEYTRELKSKRESLGLSLDDAFHKTRIRSSYLEAIENGNYDALPEPIYAKNFIRTYARFLGVNEEALLKHYEEYLQSRKVENQNSRKQHPETSSSVERAVKNKKIYGWLVVAVIALFAVWLLLKQTHPIGNSELTSPQSLEPPTQPSVVAGPSNTPQALLQTQADTQTKTEVAPPQTDSSQNKEKSSLVGESKPFNVDHAAKDLVIEAFEETWVRAQTEGEENPTEILLKPGEKLRKKGDAFRLDIGNAGGVSITFKGKNIDNIGKKGEVVHLKLPR